MCGRARCTVRPHDVPRACGINNPSTTVVDSSRFRPQYNVSPGSYMPVLRRDDGSSDGVAVHCMKWGLVPSFNKKDEKPDHFRMFNARSESVSEKPSFRRLVPHHRCLVVVEGFYEWKKDGPKKQPYYIHFKDSKYLVFAALYDSWKNSEGEILYTFTILTTQSSQALQWLHDRMPVILGSQSAINTWLHGPPATKFDSILNPYEEPDLVWYPVTSEMGKISFDGPECIKEIKLKSEETRPISKFFTKKNMETKQETKRANFGLLQSQVTDKVEGVGGELKIAMNNECIDSEEKPVVDPSCHECISVKDIADEGRTPGDLEQNPVDTFDSLIKAAYDEFKDSKPVKPESLQEDGVHSGYGISHGELGHKRVYEKFVSGADHPLKSDDISKTISPKKPKLDKEAGGNQPTLHSFFGKR